MKKYIIYTSITNKYDNLKKIRIRKKFKKNIEFYYFGDLREENDDGWNYMAYPDYLSEFTPVERNRFVKMHPHLFFKEYELSLYIDANMQIVGNVEDDIVKNKDYIISMFKHTTRNCIYDEAQVCIEMGKEKLEVVDKHMNKLANEGYPRGNGLNEGNIILRKHNDICLIKAMEDWWNEFSSYSKRDQLSLNYVLWKNKICVNPLGSSYRNSRSLLKYPHGISRNEENLIYYKFIIKRTLKEFLKVISNNNMNLK